MVPYVDIHDVDISLHDIWKDGQWLLHILWTAIPNDIRNAILAIEPKFNDHVEDTLIWSEPVSGVYSASSGYHWLSILVYGRCGGVETLACLGALFPPAWEVVNSAVSLATLCSKVFSSPVLNRTPRHVKWDAPSLDQIALNTDGSVIENKAGFGGILRSHSGFLW
ncbi:hypothetical protein SESBI_15560 [Sesbania bispinosa]|nr:hypothetical protein SESBI_15560 [Sesbania bispinosa]